MNLRGRHPGATLRLGVLLLLLCISALACADGVPAALRHSGLDLMPWPAHIQLEHGQLALTPDFAVEITGDPGTRVYGAATRVLRQTSKPKKRPYVAKSCRCGMRLNAACNTINRLPTVHAFDRRD